MTERARPIKASPMTEPRALNLAYSRGQQTVAIGDQFTDVMNGSRWEVAGWTGTSIYSPSGIGGSPCVFCRCLGDLPEYWRKWLEPDGTVEWCGDSVAAFIAASHTHGAVGEKADKA